jgi:two-component system nitrate/nitrite response regulator NarL
MQPEVIRLAIVHRDGLYRDSLTHCLGQFDQLSIVSCVGSLDHEWQAILACDPNLLIVQFGIMHRDGGLPAAISSIKRIVIGVPDSDEDILSCIEVEGAAGYVVLNASLDDLLQNIRAVMRGESLCSPRIAGLAFGRMSALARENEAKSNQCHDTGLTRREGEIVRLIDEGLSNKEIASRLHIEVSTVKNHVHNILDKLHLHNRYSAAKYLKEQGIASGRF